jgi:hypothetical protein
MCTHKCFPLSLTVSLLFFEIHFHLSNCKSFSNILFFLFCTFNTVIITLKRVSKKNSSGYRFQEHLLKLLMLAVTDSEPVIICHFKFKTFIVRLITSVANPLYFPNIISLVLCFELFFLI